MGQKEIQAIPHGVRSRLARIDKGSWSGIKDLVFHFGALVYFNAEGYPVGCKVDGVVYGQTSSIGKPFAGRDGKVQSAIIGTTLRNTYQDLDTANHDHAPVRAGHTTKRGDHAQVTRAALREVARAWYKI